MPPLKRKYVLTQAPGTMMARVYKKRKTGPYASGYVPYQRRAFRGEPKFVDTASASYACNSTGSITHISIVPTGSTVNSRDGKNFKLTSAQLRGVWAVDTASTLVQGMALLVWDKQPNKALAGITDVLDSASSYSFIKRENAQRFRIIRKWRFASSGNSTTPATGRETQDIDEYVKLPANCIAQCTSADATGVIGNRVTGALLLVTVGDIGAGTADLNFNVGIRTNFVDA